MKIKIGDRIKELRKRDGRKQEDLANALGVTNQAVSRWEKDSSYPDVEMIPSIANYFGISIDELFGYESDREKKIDSLVAHINDMNLKNNGVDINIDECIALAREAMIEFPGNEKVMLCLASVLYNAGYVRYGEHHLIDEEGYNVYDTEKHRGYAEWKEAIILYEKLLQTLEAGEMRCRAVIELTQLYLNTGEHSRAQAVIESAPSIYGSREFLRIRACDGKKHTEAFGEALLKMIRASAELIIGTVLSYEQNMLPYEKVQSIQSAIMLFDHVCTDGNYGIHNLYIARMYTLLSLYLWLDGKHDDAFEALDKSLYHFKLFEKCCIEKDATYTAPLVRLVKIEWSHIGADNESCPKALSLAEDWPWWAVREDSLVRDEMQSDPRWAEWVAKTQA